VGQIVNLIVRQIVNLIVGQIVNLIVGQICQSAADWESACPDLGAPYEFDPSHFQIRPSAPCAQTLTVN
jgi:hypothetical protein